jgi:tRNA pseudouridine38-40 synthase
MRYIIRLSYDGAEFCGWQIQTRFKSVQEELQKALSTLLRCDISVTGAGRTDTAVNAVNYIAHFDWSGSEPLQADAVSYKINAMIPKGIVVHEICECSEDFHARFDAKEREYHYFIHRKKDPFMGKFSYFCRFPLDLEAMNKACEYLLGEHDFSCFEKVGGNNTTSICTVFEASWETYTPTHASLLGYDFEEGDYIVFKVKANRFLRNMVRAIVGTMIEVGRGKQKSEWVESLIASGTRSDAGASVPGNALFFNSAKYE